MDTENDRAENDSGSAGLPPGPADPTTSGSFQERHYGTLKAGLKAAGNSGEPVWWARGYQPHVESPHLIQHVCYHLADSLPREVVEAMDAELKSLTPMLRDPEKEKRINAYLDAGRGSCVLREPEIAELVQNAFLLFHGRRYTLHAWCVMPNHVHVLFQPMEGWTMSRIVWSWKSFTGRRISEWRNRAGLKPGGPVWHREYWDRFVRDAAHYEAAIDYISMNPVKAGLVRRPEDWPYSSARSTGLQPGQAILTEGPAKPS